MNDDTAEKESWVRRRAYQLWQESGQEHGQHDDHWQQAEREYDQAMGTLSEAAEPGGDEPAGDLEQDLIETPPPAGDLPDSVAGAAGSTTVGGAATDAGSARKV